MSNDFLAKAQAEAKKRFPSTNDLYIPIRANWVAAAQFGYTESQQRVAQYLVELTGIGAGEDPIGFLIASHAQIVAERKAGYTERSKELIPVAEIDKSPNDKILHFQSEFQAGGTSAEPSEGRKESEPFLDEPKHSCNHTADCEGCFPPAPVLPTITRAQLEAAASAVMTAKLPYPICGDGCCSGTNLLTHAQAEWVLKAAFHAIGMNVDGEE